MVTLWNSVLQMLKESLLEDAAYPPTNQYTIILVWPYGTGCYLALMWSKASVKRLIDRAWFSPSLDPRVELMSTRLPGISLAISAFLERGAKISIRHRLEVQKT